MLTIIFNHYPHPRLLPTPTTCTHNPRPLGKLNIVTLTINSRSPWEVNKTLKTTRQTSKRIHSNVNRLWSDHPRRPRGSQSGREKGRDESFQLWAKKPLGTDSHRTISKTSSRCRFLIGHKKCFVLLCSIGKQFFQSSFREMVLIRPNQKRKNYRWVEKTLGMLSAGAIQLSPRIFFL